MYVLNSGYFALRSSLNPQSAVRHRHPWRLLQIFHKQELATKPVDASLLFSTAFHCFLCKYLTDKNLQRGLWMPPAGLRRNCRKHFLNDIPCIRVLRTAENIQSTAGR